MTTLEQHDERMSSIILYVQPLLSNYGNQEINNFLNRTKSRKADAMSFNYSPSG